MALARPSSTSGSSSPGVGGSTWYLNLDGERASPIVFDRITSLDEVASCLRPFLDRNTLVFLMICERRSPDWDQA
jgi:hypothetical protein